MENSMFLRPQLKKKAWKFPYSQFDLSSKNTEISMLAHVPSNSNERKDMEISMFLRPQLNERTWELSCSFDHSWMKEHGSFHVL